MIASRQVDIQQYSVVGRQRGRLFSTFVQFIAITTIALLGEYVVPAAKREGAAFSNIAAAKSLEVGGRKTFKSESKRVRKQTL